ncbi:Hypothetical predicted protein [Olea europaea subsp. europaea]|uniref:Uncharacterized protein n=1 Tax=Olea europaea subsp. europaea TaxID=158383 RepID=A0A8S0TUN2_OLEEU|nr:Hypothetical predicted protein [Olea europaea subsp. europaea]
MLAIPAVAKGSTSAKKSKGYMPTLLLASRIGSTKISLKTDEGIFRPQNQQPKNVQVCRMYGRSTRRNGLAMGADKDARSLDAVVVLLHQRCRGEYASRGKWHGGAKHCLYDGGGICPKVCTEVPISVLLLVVERGVLFQAVARVLVAKLIDVSSMMEESVVNLITVTRAIKEAPTSTRCMVVGRGATVVENVKSLQ